MLPFFTPPASAPTNEIYLTRGMTLNWPWQALVPNAQNVPVPLSLSAVGLRLLFLVKGATSDDDGNAFIIKDNYAWMGLSVTDGPNGMVLVNFIPTDTDNAIFPYYPCLLTWSLKLITPDDINVSLGSGPLVIQDNGVRQTVY